MGTPDIEKRAHLSRFPVPGRDYRTRSDKRVSQVFGSVAGTFSRLDDHITVWHIDPLGTIASGTDDRRRGGRVVAADAVAVSVSGTQGSGKRPSLPPLLATG